MNGKSMFYYKQKLDLLHGTEKGLFIICTCSQSCMDFSLTNIYRKLFPYPLVILLDKSEINDVPSDCIPKKLFIYQWMMTNEQAHAIEAG